MRRIVVIVFALAFVLSFASVAMAGPRDDQYVTPTPPTTPPPTTTPPTTPPPTTPPPTTPPTTPPATAPPASAPVTAPAKPVVVVAGTTVTQPKPTVVKSATNALPFTGFPLGIALAGGVLLLGTGLVLRRLGRPDSDK